MSPQSERICYVVNLKYSPGLLKEFVLLGNNLRQRGWAVCYLLSTGYSRQANGPRGDIRALTRSMNLPELILESVCSPVNILPQVRTLFKRGPPDLLLIYNPHPLNATLARLAEQIHPQGVRTIYLHEPFVPNKSSYGRVRALYIHLAERLQTLTLRYSNCVIVPSDHSRTLFDTRYADYGRPVYTAPILLPDRPPLEATRRYISLVGNLNQSRGPGDFIELINCAASNGEDLAFKIITRSEIAGALQRLSPQARQMVEIVNKAMISDEEIAETVAQSIAIFLPHKQAAQSGNIPVAFREATPVIARDIPGLSQHVRHKMNGYLFPFDPTPEQLLEGVRYVRDNFSRLSLRARENFEDIFAESNWERYYSWLIWD